MSRNSTLRGFVVLIAVMTMVAAGSAYVTIGDTASGDIDVFEDSAEFDATTGADRIPWVADADAALPSKPFSPSLVDYSCAWGSLTTPGGEATVVNPSPNWICYIGSGWNAGSGNTNPTPTGPTIVNNGEDDYAVTIALTQPAHAVGLDLLTNFAANETITLVFSDGDELVVDDADLGTLPNQMEFVGFRSVKPIVEVRLDTTGGASQNEGIAGIWMSPFYIPPTTSCPAGQHYVSSVGTGAVTGVVSVPSDAGYPYEVTASGTYFAGGTYAYDIQADAEYSQDAYQRANLMPWTDLVHKYESYGEGLLEMKIDGGFVEWGTYAADHSYTIGPYIATGSSVDFQIYDIYAQNNTGGLCASIEPIPLTTSISGGGQIIADSGDAKNPYKVSFGGHLYDFDGGPACEWQVNLHNVSDDVLDKAKFHTTDCFDLSTWEPGAGASADSDGVVRFYANGTFNGESGYCAIFRMEDYTEPSVMDTLRIEIYDGACGDTGDPNQVFESSAQLGGDFPVSGHYNVGGARTLLDNGNIQIEFFE